MMKFIGLALCVALSSIAFAQDETPLPTPEPTAIPEDALAICQSDLATLKADFDAYKDGCKAREEKERKECKDKADKTKKEHKEKIEKIKKVIKE